MSVSIYTANYRIASNALSAPNAAERALSSSGG